MNQHELEQILPHRKPMMLLDEAHVDDEGKARGSLYITGDEYFVQGHFPGNPIVPGVIQCEILAQTCCVLMGDELLGEMAGALTLFTGIDKVKFRNPVRPGDTFETVTEIIKQRPPFFWAKGSGYVDGKLCVSGEFSFALIKQEPAAEATSEETAGDTAATAAPAAQEGE